MLVIMRWLSTTWLCPYFQPLTIFSATMWLENLVAAVAGASSSTRIMSTHLVTPKIPVEIVAAASQAKSRTRKNLRTIANITCR